MPSISIECSPHVIQVGSNFAYPPLIVSIRNPEPYPSYFALIKLKDPNSGTEYKSKIGGQSQVSAIHDHDGTLYFMFDNTSITKKGTYRIEVEVFGFSSAGANELGSAETRRIQVVSHKPSSQTLTESQQALMEKLNSLP